MAPITTHLVIGERVFPKICKKYGPLDYGSFLLGCVLVDAHAFSKMDRRTTHFADRLDKNSEYAFDKSCQNFIARLDTLLIRPWSGLNSAEGAFVLGYLCHLAADENWKEFDWERLNGQGVYLWADLEVPGNVILTVFDVLSNRLYVDHQKVSSALRIVIVPEVFLHIPHSTLETVWDIVRVHVEEKSTLRSYLEMQKRLGKNGGEIETIYDTHRANWGEAEKIIAEYFGGIPNRIEAMVQQVMSTFSLYGDHFLEYRYSPL